MAIGYLLALLPSLGVLIGVVFLIVNFVRRATSERALILGLGFVMTFGIVSMSLSVPYYCMVKAFFGMSALVPFCVAGAIGLDWMASRHQLLRGLVFILLGVWALNSFASVWILSQSSRASIVRAGSLIEEEHFSDAAELLKGALAADPANLELRAMRAMSLASAGEHATARHEAEAILALHPRNASAHLAMASVLSSDNHLEEAMDHVRRAMESAPAYGRCYRDLGVLLIKGSRNQEASDVAREGLRVAPYDPDLRFLLGSALVALGDKSGSETQFILGAGLEPDNARGHYQAAVALEMQKRTAEAASHYESALRLRPDFAEALNNLAWIRASSPVDQLRDGAAGVRLAERACQITSYKEPLLIGTLSAAYAEAGRFEEAAATSAKARDLALAAGQTAIAEKNEELIRLFKSGRPYREQP
jgi:tetratricopeptide (TPR) repeat protein